MSHKSGLEYFKEIITLYKISNSNNISVGIVALYCWHFKLTLLPLTFLPLTFLPLSLTFIPLTLLHLTIGGDPGGDVSPPPSNFSGGIVPPPPPPRFWKA